MNGKKSVAVLKGFLISFITCGLGLIKNNI
jgi:hypothetical protein